MELSNPTLKQQAELAYEVDYVSYEVQLKEQSKRQKSNTGLFQFLDTSFAFFCYAAPAHPLPERLHRVGF